MTQSEIREIRRRIDPTLDNFKDIYGCYVNAAGDIVAKMRIPILDMDQEEKEMYAGLLKKAISGTVEKNLLSIDFETSDVGVSDEHKLLMAIKDSRAEDESMRDLLYDRIIQNLDLDSISYVILLAAETYDVPSKASAGDEWSEESESQFDYFICSICQVNDSKSILNYQQGLQEFRSDSTGSMLAAPLLGFMFPSFDDRETNIYSALYYTKTPADSHDDFIKGMFGVSDIPMTTVQQKSTFNETLAQSLGEDCSLDVMTGVQAKLAAKIDENEESGSAFIPTISMEEVEEVLTSRGVPAAKVDSFRENLKNNLGETEIINASNIVEKNRYEIVSSEAKIVTAPEQALRIKTQVIDGVKYFLVPVGADIRVNGVDISE